MAKTTNRWLSEKKSCQYIMYAFLVTCTFENVAKDKILDVIFAVDNMARSFNSLISTFGSNRFYSPSARLRSLCTIEHPEGFKYQYLYLHGFDAELLFERINNMDADVRCTYLTVRIDPVQVMGPNWPNHIIAYCYISWDKRIPHQLYYPTMVCYGDPPVNILEIENGFMHIRTEYESWKNGVDEHMKNQWHADGIRRVISHINAEVNLYKKLCDRKTKRFLDKYSNETDQILAIFNNGDNE